MKPCRKNRKLIVWLELNALESRQERPLREHLQSCPGCRGYLEEISSVAQRLNAAETRSDLEAPDSFHRRVLSALRTEETGWKALVSRLRSEQGWRVAVPVIGATTVVILALATYSRRNTVSLPVQQIVQPLLPAQNSKTDPQPTLSNYETVANQSLGKFDEFLSRLASRNPPAALIYRAASLTPENGND